MSKIRRHLSYANVMATIAVFGVLGGGGAYAASKLKKNSVTSDIIKNGQVKKADLADGAVTGSKIHPPAAFKSVGFGNSEGGSVCGSAGFVDVWANWATNANNEVSYFRDPYGIVHLRGIASRCGSPAAGDLIFNLPAGYRPVRQEVQSTLYSNGLGRIDVDASGNVSAESSPPQAVNWVSLDGLTFRCAPSGSAGCP